MAMSDRRDQREGGGGSQDTLDSCDHHLSGDSAAPERSRNCVGRLMQRDTEDGRRGGSNSAIETDGVLGFEY